MLQKSFFVNDMIRPAEHNDLSRINEIYSQAILKKFQTADSTPYSLDERMVWFKESHSSGYPVLVYVEDDLVTGWVTLSKYRKGRQALRNTVEVSYYVDENHQGNGIGTKLLQAAVEAAHSLGYKNIIAMLLAPNVASVGLLKKFGFLEWGRIPDAAEIDGQTHDHLYYGLKIN